MAKVACENGCAATDKDLSTSEQLNGLKVNIVEAIKMREDVINYIRAQEEKDNENKENNTSDDDEFEEDNITDEHDKEKEKEKDHEGDDLKVAKKKKELSIASTRKETVEEKKVEVVQTDKLHKARMIKLEIIETRRQQAREEQVPFLYLSLWFVYFFFVLVLCLIETS